VAIRPRTLPHFCPTQQHPNQHQRLQLWRRPRQARMLSKSLHCTRRQRHHQIRHQLRHHASHHPIVMLTTALTFLIAPLLVTTARISGKTNAARLRTRLIPCRVWTTFGHPQMTSSPAQKQQSLLMPIVFSRQPWHPAMRSLQMLRSGPVSACAVQLGSPEPAVSFRQQESH